MTSVNAVLVILVLTLFLAMSSTMGSIISIPILAFVTTIIILKYKKNRSDTFALIGMSLWTLEELVHLYSRYFSYPLINISDVLYFSGALFWIIAFVLKTPKSSPKKGMIFTAPVVMFGLWIAWQALRVDFSPAIIVEILLFSLNLPLVSASIRAKAHSGRFLIGFAFYIRIIANAILLWQSPALADAHLYFLLFTLSYGFLALGLFLEFTNSDNSLITTGFSIISMELLIAIVMILFHSNIKASQFMSNISIAVFAYLLFLSTFALIYSDRLKRLGAEQQLRNYSGLLEHILSINTESLATNFKLEDLERDLYIVAKASFPSLSGIKFLSETGSASVFGQTEGIHIDLVSDNVIVGKLYFSEEPRDVQLIENIEPLLANYIKNTLSHVSSQTEAITDPLTNLMNRRGYDFNSKQLLKLAKKHNLPVSLVLIDIDRFKQINDSYGHEIGDQVLIKISSILRQNIRNQDLAIRWGGEEFLLLLYEADIEVSKTILERIVADVQNANFAPLDKPPTFSAGISGGVVPNGTDFLNMLSKADRAMYKAKNSGRNKTIILN